MTVPFNVDTFKASLASDNEGAHIGVYELTNGSARVLLTNFGATLLELRVPDRCGVAANVVLNHPTLAAYRSPTNRFFGATVGRFANRIADGVFTLGDEKFVLEKNNNGNALHGGSGGFHARVWTVLNHDAQRIVFRLVSADGDQGYPGELTTTVTFELDAHKNSLSIQYCATTTRSTPINLTNHSYFNLTGRATEGALVLDHEVLINNIHKRARRSFCLTSATAFIERSVLHASRPEHDPDRRDQERGQHTARFFSHS